MSALLPDALHEHLSTQYMLGQPNTNQPLGRFAASLAMTSQICHGYRRLYRPLLLIPPSPVAQVVVVIAIHQDIIIIVVLWRRVMGIGGSVVSRVLHNACRISQAKLGPVTETGKLILPCAAVTRGSTYPHRTQASHFGSCVRHICPPPTT